MSTPWEYIANLIDYADLRLDTQERDLRLLCLEAEKTGISTIVVNPINVSLAAKLAKSLNIKVAAAVSYPIGAYWPEAKAMEIDDAVEDGADEIYMVMSVGLFLDGRIAEQTIPEMTSLVKGAQGRPTKLVTEVSVLADDQKRLVCRLAVDAGINYLVTSTDFPQSNLPPVTLDDVKILVETAGDYMGIIYKGDLDNVAQVKELLEVGVSRFCTSTVIRLQKAYQLNSVHRRKL